LKLKLASTLLFISLTSFVADLHADEKLKGVACRSVHLWYQAPVGEAFYNEIAVEKSAEGTYFMVCGWSKGYFGIQELGDGKKVVLFSVWDPASGDYPKKVPTEKRVKMLHKDDAVLVKRFGAEGTGGQSFFDYDWQVGKTYRLMVSAKPDGDDRTAYSGWFFIPEAKKWKKLVTFSTLTPKGEQLRGYYSFVEDFRRNKISATKVRKAQFGGGWVKSSDGQWQSLVKVRFTGDGNPATDIDAGLIGERFFLATGDDTENKTTKLRGSIERTADIAPPSDMPKFE
jgi:Domain of unknown function (DUF3472)